MSGPRPVPFGLLFVCQDPPDASRLAERWAEILDLSSVAEEAGFASLHVPEHHLRDDGYLPQPLVACAAIAARTKRALVGPTLLVAPLRHPVHLAEEAAVVDVLSSGRLVLGVGIGNFQPEYDLFGIQMREQARRFDECLDVLRGASPVAAPLRPRPVQAPHPPLWVGAMSHPGAVRAAERGDALLLDPLHTVGALEPIVASYRDAAARAGRPATVVLMRWGWIEDQPGDAERLWWPHVRPALWTYVRHIPRFREDVDPRVATMTSEDELDLASLRPDRFLVGTAEEIRASVDSWRERLGVDHVVVKLQGETGPWGADLRDAVVRFGERVIAPGVA